MYKNKVYYKICDMFDGEYKTLFHPSDIGRKIPVGKCVRAVKKRVRDGRGKNWYISGWHVMESLEEALDYLERFTYVEHKVIVECACMNLRPKPSPHNVWLADKIRMSDNYYVYSRA